MFQNRKNAEREAEKFYTEAVKQGTDPRTARRAATGVAKRLEREYDEWTRKNVGLN